MNKYINILYVKYYKDFYFIGIFLLIYISNLAYLKYFDL